MTPTHARLNWFGKIARNLGFIPPMYGYWAFLFRHKLENFISIQCPHCRKNAVNISDTHLDGLLSEKQKQWSKHVKRL